MMEEQNELMQRALHEAIERVCKTDEGRQCFFWIMSLCGLYEDGFSGDNNLTNYRLGRQSIAKQIIATMNAIDGEFYPRFLLECAMLRDKNKQAERAERFNDE